MWLRIVRARRSASTSAATVVAHAEPPVELCRGGRPAHRRALGVGHGEERRPAAGLAELAPIADLPAALGVERRPVEDDLGLAADPVSSSYSMPSRTMATTVPSAVVVS